MAPFVIREPQKDEIFKCIKTFLLSFGRPVLENLEEAKIFWTQLIDNEIGRFLIAVENGKIIGIGGLFVFQDVGSIGYMGVLPEYRKQGIGTNIFSELMKLGTYLRCKTIILYASKFGEPIYKKYGFQGSYYVSGYNLSKKIPKSKAQYQNVKIAKSLPGWLLNLDKKAVGFNRSYYLNLRVKLGAQILMVENKGFALLSNAFSNKRLGPLISTDLDVSLQIIKKAISLDADSLIIPEYALIADKILPFINDENNIEAPNLEMFYGKKLIRKLDYIYALGSYSKG
ncbi:MAG: GNAT family N-acetyltransferase [Promethearchaeota archaeon]